jgi:threonyl-tRNA synthetase
MAQVHLSTRPVGENATVGSDKAWEAATAALTQALDDVGLDYEVDEGEGAFYGKR